MHVHRALHHRVRRLRVHEIRDRMYDLVAFDAEQRRAQEAFALGIHETFMKPCVSPRSRARPTRLMGIFAISALRPDFRTSASLMPTRPSGGSINSA